MPAVAVLVGGVDPGGRLPRGCAGQKQAEHHHSAQSGVVQAKPCWVQEQASPQASPQSPSPWQPSPLPRQASVSKVPQPHQKLDTPHAPHAPHAPQSAPVMQRASMQLGQERPSTR